MSENLNGKSAMTTVFLSSVTSGLEQYRESAFKWTLSPFGAVDDIRRRHTTGLPPRAARPWSSDFS